MSPTFSDHSTPTGQRVRMLRRARHLTQRELARRTGLAEPFLSRIENGRAQPSVRTLERLANGLGLAIGDLLGAGPGSFRAACPVSQSGRCIAELIYRPGRTLTWPAERYTPRQIALLRLSNYVVQFGSPEALAALETVLRGMMKLPGTRRDPRWLRVLNRRAERKPLP